MRKCYLALVLCTLTVSCEENGGEGNILIKARHDGRIIDQATVYLKKGTDQDPNIPLTSYDQIQRADGSGEAYFKSLKPDKYYLFARGYDQQEKRYVEGRATVTIKALFTSNTRTISLQLN